MPRTVWNSAPATGGQADARLLHTQRLTDHVGAPCRRVYFAEPNDPIPSDFHEQPRFCFQIYSTVPLSLDVDPASEEQQKRSNLNKLVEYLIDPGRLCDLSQCRSPLMDIYETVFPESLACVEHQRREIQHRKAQRQERSIALIPKLVRNNADARKTGFLLLVTSEIFKAGVNSHFYSQGYNSAGPRWIWFDRRLPLAIDVPIKDRFDEDVYHQQIVENEDGPQAPPAEKMEVYCQVHQEQPESMSSNLAMLYSSSYYYEKDPGMDLGLEEDEGEHDAEMNNMMPPIGSASLMDLEIIASTGVIEVRSINLNTSEPTIRYVVYVQFCPPDNLIMLRRAAERFTTSLRSRLQPNTTFSLQFYASPTLSSIIMSHRRLRAENSLPTVGALATSTAIAYRSMNGDVSPAERIYPISKQAGLAFNDPTRTSWEPYQTFIVVLDRPDFDVKPGVLFLLAEGGHKKPRDNAPSAYTVFANYPELQVWRSAGMDEVAKRLSMDYPEVV